MITIHDAIKMLRTEIAGREDDTANCQYVNRIDRKPVCVVGCVLVNQIKIDPIVFIDARSAFTGPDRRLDDIDDESPMWKSILPEDFTQDAYDVLNIAQAVQDERPGDAIDVFYRYNFNPVSHLEHSTWGNALNVAEDFYAQMNA